MAFFRPSDPFVRADGLNLGPKFEYYLTKGTNAVFLLRQGEPYQNVEGEDARQWAKGTVRRNI